MYQYTSNVSEPGCVPIVSSSKVNTNEYANESDSNEMEENVPLLPTMEVDLIMNSKRAKSIHVTSGCILRLYEPWLELASMLILVPMV